MMILSVISSYISIDQIIQSKTEKYVHFISYLDDAFVIPSEFESIIYTSKHIARLLALKKTAIPLKHFRIVKPDKPFVFTIGGVTIKATMFTNSSYSGNLMFHFENESRTVLYTGRMLNTRILIRNQFLLAHVAKGIDLMYIDNTRCNSTNLTSIENAGMEIRDIHRKYPGHQIFLSIPPFGYEDLLVSLVKIHNLKVTIGKLLLKAFEDYDIDHIFERDHKKANIIVGEENIAVDKIERRFRKHKKISLRLIEFDYEPKNLNFDKFGFFQVHWSPHPSLFDMYSFIQTLSPKSVVEIFDDLPKLPKFINALCKYKDAHADNDKLKINIEDPVMQEPTNPAEEPEVPTKRSVGTDCIVINEGIFSSRYNLPKKKVHKGTRNAVMRSNLAAPKQFAEFLADSTPSDISRTIDNEENQICTKYLEVEKKFGKIEKIIKNKPKKDKKPPVRESSNLSTLDDVLLLSPSPSELEVPVLEKKKRQKQKYKAVKIIQENYEIEKPQPVPMCAIPEKTKISLRSKPKNKIKMQLLSCDLD